MSTTPNTTTFTYDNRSLSENIQLELYRNMLKSRLIEEKMLILLRQGKISKWFSGIGQEAISVGVTMAMNREEYILPMHRNLGVFTTRGIPLERLFAQWQGKLSGYTRGRDRSFHFGDNPHRIVGMISHLGPQLGVADGIALAAKLNSQKEAVAVFTGEGATSEGDFHEALNLASVWDLPVIFCIENNGYGLSTPVNEQYRCEHLADRASGYGMESYIVEGNNILEVYQKLRNIAADIRENPRPVLVEFKTFRRRGHEEASGVAYVPEELIKAWEEKDPISNYRQFLVEEGILDEETETQYISTLKSEIDQALKTAFSEAPVEADTAEELLDVYAPAIESPNTLKPGGETTELRFVDAISEGLKQAMEQHPDLVIMGQDIAEYGGVFKITEGFVDLFGKDRVRNTPICESIVVSAAMGLSIKNKKSVVEMQFADFVSTGFNPIVNYLAKVHYRWGQSADVVVRMPCGAGVGAGPFHSQTNEAWFLKTPGLKVVYPAFPADAKGLLTASIEDPNPVLFFEHKALYRTLKQEVPKNYYTLELGKAAVLREGTRAVVISYGAGVHWAIEAMEAMGVADVALIDLRTLQPLDKVTIFEWVKRTGKVLVVHEDTSFMGFGAELAAMIQEACFQYLDAPVIRVGSLDTPVPFAKSLEQNYLPGTRLREALQGLLDY
ncbi:alpha-ketoacid dehydrogenase subunit alpha/beta [Robertkochia flava]|uniref:alpha-ketoacid dehydrogenase subunit alpha/beta n=1 Tax=Robertkochia flava TaxID=3447986 RepID=UPI001CCEDA33|nr:dehydrogenase E1 component subunit alpha/beta [Robertkochia marina]